MVVVNVALSITVEITRLLIITKGLAQGQVNLQQPQRFLLKLYPIILLLIFGIDIKCLLHIM